MFLIVQVDFCEGEIPIAASLRHVLRRSENRLDENRVGWRGGAEAQGLGTPRLSVLSEAGARIGSAKAGSSRRDAEAQGSELRASAS
jgi:hypothetical protein